MTPGFRTLTTYPMPTGAKIKHADTTKPSGRITGDSTDNLICLAGWKQIICRKSASWVERRRKSSHNLNPQFDDQSVYRDAYPRGSRGRQSGSAVDLPSKNRAKETDPVSFIFLAVIALCCCNIRNDFRTCWLSSHLMQQEPLQGSLQERPTPRPGRHLQPQTTSKVRINTVITREITGENLTGIGTGTALHYVLGN